MSHDDVELEKEPSCISVDVEEADFLSWVSQVKEVNAKSRPSNRTCWNSFKRKVVRLWRWPRQQLVSHMSMKTYVQYFSIRVKSWWHTRVTVIV